jgi:predicted Fe-Mo cluster-binding NifX family protein
MKIVVTSSGETLDSPVDPRFGRAAKFIVYDTDSKEFEVVDNAQNINLPQGAGIQAAGTVSRLGAQGLVTGHCGPKAYRTLAAAGVKVYLGAQGTVAEAIESFEQGRLESAGGPDVQGHW